MIEVADRRVVYQYIEFAFSFLQLVGEVLDLLVLRKVCPQGYALTGALSGQFIRNRRQISTGCDIHLRAPGDKTARDALANTAATSGDAHNFPGDPEYIVKIHTFLTITPPNKCGPRGLVC